jgi:hypothetical protein
VQEVARSIIEDPRYKEIFLARLSAGTLDPMIEMAIIELAEGRTPLATSCAELTSPSQSRSHWLRPSGSLEGAVQSPTLAFVRKVEP